MWQGWARTTTAVSKLALLQTSVFLLMCFGQETRLEDVPRGDISPEAIQRLPLRGTLQIDLREALRSRDYPRAETLLRAEIGRNPPSFALLTLMGRILFLEGKYSECTVAMKKAQTLAPLSSHDRFMLSLAYIILRENELAQPELEELTQVAPGDPRYSYWLGRINYQAQKFETAIADFKKTLDLDPKFTKAYDNLALSFEALGRAQDAIRYYQEGIHLNRQLPSPSAWPPLNLATLLIKDGKLDEAEPLLKESLRYDPRFSKAHFQTGLLLYKKKRDIEAVEALRQAVKTDPSFPEPHYILGKVYRRLGNSHEADTEFETFQKLKLALNKYRPH